MCIKKIFCVLVLVVLLGSCRSDQDCFLCDLYQNEDSLADGKVIDYDTQSLYEVTGSDSLTSIARKYGATSNDIISMNNLKRPYTLKPGMLIKVPTIRTEEEHNEINTQEGPAKKQKIIEIKPSRKK
jgi:spore germination protein YaaH